jgi:hypothetical protein
MSNELKITDSDDCEISFICNNIYKPDAPHYKDTINVDIDGIAEVDITSHHAVEIIDYLKAFLSKHPPAT